MDDLPSSASSDFVLSDFQVVTNPSKTEKEKLVGLRFSFLIRQNYDRAVAAGKKHGFYEELAAAIGCSGSLLHKWKDPEKVRAGLEGREGISAKIIAGVREALAINAEYFFVDAKDFPNHVVLADGSTRAAEPDEVDCYAPVFDLKKKREQLDTATRKQVVEHDTRILALESENVELRATNARILALLERLLPNVSKR